MEQIDNTNSECLECEDCLFREKIKQNKNTLFIFSLIVAFFIGALFMFLALVPVLLEKENKSKQHLKNRLDIPAPHIIEIYNKPERILYTI